MYSISHVGLVVKDCQRSVDFYEGVLGCQLLETYEDNRVKIAFLKAGDGLIELVQYLSETISPCNGGLINHLAFEVEDIKGAVAYLKESGASLLMDEPREVLGGTRLIINFTGPDGERLELTQSL
ncbi:MAG: VOC family protein [Bacillota bacterium]|jgi:lactoylglutathione lyase